MNRREIVDESIHSDVSDSATVSLILIVVQIIFKTFLSEALTILFVRNWKLGK
jgi:hypothetical protein